MISRPYQLPETLTESLRHSAHANDQSSAWPAADLVALKSIGALKWSVPKEFGGDDFPAVELHLRYESLAAASLAMALILTQRDSAVAMLAATENIELRDELLP